MWLAKLISIVVLVLCVRWLVRSWRKPTIIYWRYLEYLHHPVTIVQDAIGECYGRGDKPLQGAVTTDMYARGDARIRRVSDARRVRLSDIPSTLSITVEADTARTLVTLQLDIDREVRMSQSVAAQFDRSAEAELTAVMQQLQQTAARIQQDREAQWQRPRDEPSGTSIPPVPPVPPAGLADFTALGLKPEATFEQVQAAYRDACRKYHPDRLTGQSVEPHLVELATQRFKEVSAAYQRLKDRLGQPQHA